MGMRVRASVCLVCRLAALESACGHFDRVCDAAAASAP